MRGRGLYSIEMEEIMKAKKILGLLLAVTMTVGPMTACGNGGNDQAAVGTQAGSGQQSQQESQGGADAGSDNAGNGETENTTPFYMTLDPNVSGEIDIMTWSGDGLYHADMGHWDADEQVDLTGSNVAMVYAMAKKFNEMYPNVKINLYAKSGNENGNDTSWDQ